MRRVLLITNPVAARTRSRTVPRIEQVFRDAGWEIDVRTTTAHGDALVFAQEGVANGVDVVAVFGGDGTTMQAATALVGTNVALGLIPGGTGNLLAANLGLPMNPVRAARAIVAGEARPIDLGRLENSAGVQYFAVAAGAGIDALVMTETSSAMKRKWGTMAYVATTVRLLPKVQTHRFRITVDGEMYEAEAAMILVANCGMMIPPIISIGDDVSPFDGLLDIVVVQATSVAGGIRAIWDLVRDAKGTYGKDVFVARRKGKEVQVEVVGAVQPVQLDGDGGGETPFSVKLLPGALSVVQMPR
jgi:YegS/Rv2252/BmrU family lipid kinase